MRKIAPQIRDPAVEQLSQAGPVQELLGTAVWAAQTVQKIKALVFNEVLARLKWQRGRATRAVQK